MDYSIHYKHGRFFDLVRYIGGADEEGGLSQRVIMGKDPPIICSKAQKDGDDGFERGITSGLGSGIFNL